MAAVVVVASAALTGGDGKALPQRLIYLDPAYPPAERAADLVSRMSLSEKAAQLISSQSKAVPRLGVAAYGWWNEAAHGVAREQTNDGDQPPDLTNTTSYPVSLSLGATWDPDLVYREASMISDEAREVVRGNRYDLDFYAPTVNLARDPRWGRNDETFGEDPVLTAALAAQYVNGIQGQTEQGTPLPGSNGYLKAIATLKHYAANNSESNRLNGSSDVDERSLREYYTAQFRDIVATAHPGAIMSSYNSVNGVPAAANVHLIDTLARQTYGFGGYFTSDCDAIFVMQNGQNWQPPGYPRIFDQYARTAYALTAGEDLECDMAYHDEWNYSNTIPAALGIRTPAGVLTVNDVDTAALRLLTARIALGEFDAESRVPWVAAARARLAPGTWVNSDANHAVTQTPQRLAMARAVAAESIVLLKNAGGLLPLRPPARILVLGPAADSPDLYLGGYTSRQGRAGVAHEVSCYQGIQAAYPRARVDYQRGLAPGDDDSVEPAAIAAAKGYDVAIVCAGTDRATSSEDHDRATLALPGAQAELIRRVAAANPRTVVYLETVGQVDVRSFEKGVPAILWSSYNGQQQGAALADVLSGAAGPSGRLPFTWYADEDELSAPEDYALRPGALTAGRTYQYFTGSIAYPFGYGLTYTGFRYADLSVTPDLKVTATVTNTGDRAGAEVAQLYVTTPDAPAAAQRPKKRLAGFRRVALGPHRSARITIPVRESDLTFFDEKTGAFRPEAGRYGLQLSASSADRDVRLQTYVRQAPPWSPGPAVVTAKPVTSGDAARGVTQRLFFPAGARIEPRLTVALSDQTLYGYVAAGRSRPLPSGMSVRYTSDRPSVVSAGLVTRAPGVATVTAEVTYRGVTRTGSFVVDVR